MTVVARIGAAAIVISARPSKHFEAMGAAYGDQQNGLALVDERRAQRHQPLHARHGGALSDAGSAHAGALDAIVGLLVAGGQHRIDGAQARQRVLRRGASAALLAAQQARLCKT